MKKEALLIFAKNLKYGHVKTRLAATVGNKKALSVYKQLLYHTVSITQELKDDKIVFYSDSINEKDVWKNNVYKKQIQDGDTLGMKMENAFKSSFTAGYKKIVIIGTDCFELKTDNIRNAFDSLNNYDIVIGPATDGGYYLLGMKKEHPFLFKNIKWSTSSVLKDTIGICNQNQLSFFLLPELSDIDEEKDLIHFKNYLI